MGERGWVILAAVLPLLAGCAVPPAEPAAPPAAPPVAPGPRHVVFPAGESVEGRPVVAHEIGDGAGAVLFIATIHGNEAAGTPLLRRLAVELLRRPKLLAGRRAVIVPVANPDGMARGVRANARGVDLNRNFPAANFRPGGPGGREPLSEPEARALLSLLDRYRPVRVVSIHQPLAVVDWDGPARDLAAAMARAAGLRARRLGGRPGSMGSFVGKDRGTPIVTVELPVRAGTAGEDALWRRYGGMLLLALRE